MQGFLSRDGMPPADLLAAGRREVAGYGVDLVEDQVVGIEAGFYVRFAGGAVLRSRRILVTTGVRDELPDIPGVRERCGRRRRLPRRRRDRPDQRLRRVGRRQRRRPARR
jgi:thioredoxin reductase